MYATPDNLRPGSLPGGLSEPADGVRVCAAVARTLSSEENETVLLPGVRIWGCRAFGFWDYAWTCIEVSARPEFL